MIIELNPLKWIVRKKVAAAPAVAPVAPAAEEVAPAKAEESVMGFVKALEFIGKGFAKGLKWAVTYAVPIERLVALLFPAAAPAVKELGDATELIQNAVILVEQKYAASGVQTGTGAQKLAEVLTLTEAAVTSLLAKADIKADTDYISRIVSAVVAILNVQQVQAAS